MPKSLIKKLEDDYIHEEIKQLFIEL